MTKKTSISFVLSQEELKLMLAYFKIASLMGFDSDVFEELSERELSIVMGVAERALFARGFLEIDADNNIKISEVPYAVVGACVSPETSLIIRKNIPDSLSELYFFHAARKMAVYHAVPVTAMHQFIALEDKQAMSKSAFSLLELGTLPALDCPAGELTDEVISNARDAMDKNDHEAAMAILKKTALDPQTIQEFFVSLQKPLYNHTIVHFDHDPDGEDVEKGFSLLAGENGLWMLQPIEEVSPGVNKVKLAPVSVDDVAAKIKEYILSE